MMVCFRLLAGLTSFISNRAWSHNFSMGPDGTLECNSFTYLTNPISTDTGMEMLPAAMRMATTAALRFTKGV